MRVDLYIYDLSQGSASQFSGLLGFRLDAIWHTSVVVFGTEYFFGSSGIQQSVPGQTMLGAPLRIEHMGDTAVDLHLFRTVILEWGSSRFRGSKYRLLEHNCNTFSQELCQFLVNKDIPSEILELPRRVLQSPLGSMLAPMLESLNPTGNELEERDRMQHVPLIKCAKFDNQVNIEAMSKKIRSFGDKSETQIELLCNLASNFDAVNEHQWLELCKMVEEWPKNHLIPLFDVLRYVLSKKQAGKDVQQRLFKGCIKALRESNEDGDEDFKLVMVASKMAANVVSQQQTAVNSDHLAQLVQILNEGLVHKLFRSSSKALAATAALLANSTSNISLDESCVIALLDLLLNTLLSHKDLKEETAYFVVVAVGTLANKYTVAKDAAKAMDAANLVQRVDNVSPRVAEAVAQCHDVINK